ncbi:MAG TPA: hypothetical protein VF170_08480, partial [Planctomycetaceae bacterium]
MSHRLAFVLSVVLTAPVVAADLPQVETVERQPLLSQATRLSEALEAIGSPLSAEAKAELDHLKSATDDAAVAAAVQELFDPLCVAAVELTADGPKAVAADETPELVEQGW